jgi:hypothetical protein
MHWKETCAMNKLKLFIGAWLEHDCDTAKLYRRFDISRKTGYK